MAIDIDAIRKAKEKAEARDSKFYGGDNDGTEFWYPKEGKNIIRILPALDGKIPYKDCADHFIGGKYVRCPLVLNGDPCPICELAEELFESHDEENKKLAKSISAQGKGIWIIVDRNDESLTPRFWIPSGKIHKEIRNLLCEETYGDFTDILKGRDFQVKKETAKVPNKRDKITYTILALDPVSLSRDKDELKKILESIPKDFSGIFAKKYDKLMEIVSTIKTNVDDKDPDLDDKPTNTEVEKVEKLMEEKNDEKKIPVEEKNDNENVEDSDDVELMKVLDGVKKDANKLKK